MSGSIAARPGLGHQAVFNSMMPQEGPKSVYLTLGFDGTTQSVFADFTQAYETKQLSLLQSIWFDATENLEPTRVTIEGTGQTLYLPGGSFGSLPVIAAIRPKLTFFNEEPGTVNVVLLNVPLPEGVYTKNLQRVIVVPNSPNPIGPEAFEIVIGGTPVTVFSATSITNGGFITNPAGATESLFVDFINTAETTSPGSMGTNVELFPGSSITLPGGLPTDVTANAVTGGHTFTAAAW